MLVYLVVALTFIFAFIIYQNIRHKPRHLAIVLGSGGHTAEMIITLRQVQILQRKEIKKIYLIKSKTDSNSVQKFQREFLNDLKNNNIIIISIPRSREVGQSYLTSIFTTLYSLCYALWVLRIDVTLLLCNGPGTCLPVILVLKLYNFYSLKLIFFESYCRVKTLSLTGKIINRLSLAHEFIVHWPELKQKYKGVKYLGQLF